MSTIEIALKPGDRLIITTQESQRGPKSLPPAMIPASTLHVSILSYLGGGIKSAPQIQAEMKRLHTGATTNTIAWALVELQNSSRKRSKTPDFKGPVEKTDAGYVLRA